MTLSAVDAAPGEDRRKRSTARSWPVTVALVATMVLVTAVGVSLSRHSTAASGPLPFTEAAVEAAATTTTTTSTSATEGGALVITLGATPPVTEDPGPIPDPLPEDPYAPTPQVVLGQIEIPALGVVGDMQEGMTLTAINRGPGHWPGTPMPGEQGNMVIAGHRTTFTKPFNRLNELVAGDLVHFHMPTGTVTYAVRGVIIVPAANIGIAAQNKAHTATLFACHPLHSAAQRIVAKLALLGPDGLPVDAEADLPSVDAGSDPVTDTTLHVRDIGQGGDASSSGDPLAEADS